jgi:hypothetical protein
MKTIMKNATLALLLVLMTVVDIPLLPVEMVTDAEAILGVRRRTARRTAVVAYSAGAASATAASHAAAPAPQQPAPPPQQPAPSPQPVSAVPIGTVVETLPGGCTPVTVGNVKYQDCAGSFYRTAFQGNNLVYVVSEKPL